MVLLARFSGLVNYDLLLDLWGRRRWRTGFLLQIFWNFNVKKKQGGMGSGILACCAGNGEFGAEDRKWNWAWK